MPLNQNQEDDVKAKVIKQFGEDAVKKMDHHYMELNDLRMASETSYEFLGKIRETFKDESKPELILAAILYGMKQGELGYQYYMMQNGLEARPIDEPKSSKREKKEPKKERAPRGSAKARRDYCGVEYA